MKTEADSKALIEVLEDAGYMPRPYSGRGMFNKECVGVGIGKGINNSLWDLAQTLTQVGGIPEPISDQLGLGMIYYWPAYPWPANEAEERDDDEV